MLPKCRTAEQIEKLLPHKIDFKILNWKIEEWASWSAYQSTAAQAVREKWGKRQLERQFNSCLFERIVLNPPKVAPVARQIHPATEEIFKDSYFVEFFQTA